MKRAFGKPISLQPRNLKKLELVNGVVEEYQQAGYTLTLRQLYYQLVARGIIPNAATEYKKLGSLLVKGRMGGLVL